MPKYIYRVTSQDLAVADLILEARVDEGFEVIDIGIIGGAAGVVAQLIIGNEIMTGLPCDAAAENIVPVPGLETNQNPLLSTLLKKFPALPMYKVSSGERLVVSSGGAAGVCHLLYRQFAGAEISAKTVDGASEGAQRLYFSHGKSEVTVGIGATVDVIAATELNPVGLPGFPFGELVPVNTEFDLLGFCCSLGGGSGANVTFDGLRLWKLQESILVRDQGFVIPGLYPYNRDNVDKPMFMLPTPLNFVGQEELKVEVRTTNAGAAPQVSQIFFTFAFLMRFLK
jgi:hypothetical protein